jgi:hypothetical protein
LFTPLLKKPCIVFYLIGLFLVNLGAYWLEKRWAFPQGLEGKYYASQNWQGTPRFVSRDPEISTMLLKDRRKRFSQNRFSVEWSGFIAIEKAGSYTFATASDDGSFLYINNQQIVDNGGSHGLKEVRGRINLEAGVYPVLIRYFQAGGYYQLDLSWAFGERSLENLPSHLLFSRQISLWEYKRSQLLTQLIVSLKWLWSGTFIYFVILYPVKRAFTYARTHDRPLLNPFLYETGLVALLLIALILTFFYDIVFQGKTLMTTNSVPGTMHIGAYNYQGPQPPAVHVIDPAASAQIHEPTTHLTSLLYKKGIIPLWNPHAAIGIPLNADMISAVFFPLSFMLYRDPRAWMWDVFMLLRIFIAGLLAYVFFRKSLEFSILGALTGAIAYMFCGHLVLQINIVFMHAAMLLPGLLYFADKLAHRGNWRNVCLTGAMIGLLILGGHPEPSFFALFYASVYYLVISGQWSVVRSECRMQNAERRIRSPFILHHPSFRIGYWLVTMALWAGSVAFGLIFSAIMVVPFLELVKLSPLGPHDPAFKIGTAYLPLLDMVLLVFPYFWGPLSDSVRFIDWQMQPGYLGIIMALSVLLTILERTAFTKRMIFFTGMTLFFILKGYGIPPEFSHLVGSLPIFKVSYFTRYFGPEFLFSTATLAGFQIYRIEQGKSSSKSLIGLAFLLTVLLFTLSHYGLTLKDPQFKTFWQVLLTAILCLVLGLGGLLVTKGILASRSLAWLACVSLTIELFWLVPRTHYNRQDPFVEPPYIRFLKNDPGVFRVYGLDGYLYPNIASAYELNDVGYVNGLVINRFQEFSEHFIDKNLARWFFTGYSPYGGTRNLGTWFWDLLNLTYVITAPNGEDPKYHLDSFSNIYTAGLTDNGRLTPGRDFGQTFKANENNLAGIRIFFTKSPENFEGQTIFRLKETPDNPIDVYTTQIDLSQIQGAYHLVTFPPITDSGGRSFYFEVEMPLPDKQSGKEVTNKVPILWTNVRDTYPEGQAYIDGKPVPGDAGFMTYTLSAHASFEKIYQGEVKIYKNNNAFPRVFLVHQIEVISDKKNVLVRLGEENLDLRRTVLLEEEPKEAQEYGSAGVWECENVRMWGCGSSEIILYESTRITLKTQLEQPGFMVLSEPYYPGWRVYVDGQERKIYLADYFLRAVFLEKGEHQVEFLYLPASYKVGAWLTLMGLSLVVTTLVVYFRSRG